MHYIKFVSSLISRDNCTLLTCLYLWSPTLFCASNHNSNTSFTNSLSWSPQVKAVLKKAYGVLWMLKRVFPCTTTTTAVKRKLYLSLVIPIVSYCCQVWRPSLIKDIVALELLQRHATKYRIAHIFRG